MPPSRLFPRPAAALWCATAAALALGVLPTTDAAARPVSSTRASLTSASSTRSTITPGVTLTTSSFVLRSGSARLPERSVVVRTALGPHTSLVAAAPHNVIGAPRATVLAMARAQHAVAGINGDFFYLSDPTAVPRGGLSWHGRILKSTLANQQAALYVNTRGFAAIGNPGFSGSITTATGHTHGIATMNSLENARNGGTTVVDSTVMSRSLPHCAVSLLTSRQGGGYTVSGTWARATRFTRVAAGDRALVSCSASNARWFPATLTRGLAVSLTAGYAQPQLSTVLSGGRVLVRSGKRYDDTAGLLGYGRQHKPESFVCVQRGGRAVMFGAVEGDRPGVAGMTYTELSGYLQSLGCWTAMTLDGSASSTVVAARPGHALAVQNHTTNKGGPRQVVDGLFVVRT